MKLIKSIAFATAALCCSVAFAEGGSERANQAAQKMRIAQEARFEDQRNSETSRLVNSDEKSRNERMTDAEG